MAPLSLPHVGKNIADKKGLKKIYFLVAQFVQWENLRISTRVSWKHHALLLRCVQKDTSLQRKRADTKKTAQTTARFRTPPYTAHRREHITAQKRQDKERQRCARTRRHDGPTVTCYRKQGIKSRNISQMPSQARSFDALVAERSIYARWIHHAKRKNVTVCPVGTDAKERKKGEVAPLSRRRADNKNSKRAEKDKMTAVNLPETKGTKSESTLPPSRH